MRWTVSRQRQVRIENPERLSTMLCGKLARCAVASEQLGNNFERLAGACKDWRRSWMSRRTTGGPLLSNGSYCQLLLLFSQEPVDAAKSRAPRQKKQRKDVKSWLVIISCRMAMLQRWTRLSSFIPWIRMAFCIDCDCSLPLHLTTCRVLHSRME